MDYISTLTDQLGEQTLLDWTITLTAIVYVFLAARENAWCWVWGIVSCSLWAYADFARYNLWVDGILQIFYVGMGGWGLYTWKFGQAAQKPLPISTRSLMYHLRLSGIGMVMTLLLGVVFDAYTPTALPYPDSFITAFSIIATILTVKKVLENWLYWIVVDFMAIFLFGARGAILVAFVMVVYTIISVSGYIHWRKKWRLQ